MTRISSFCWNASCGFVLLANILTTLLYAAEGGQADDPVAQESERIARLIDQLGSISFDERQIAAKELIAIGKPARTQLIAARQHKSAEVRSRVASLLRLLQVEPLRDAFRAFAAQAEERLNLEEGMWLISRILNPDVERESLSKQLDILADRVRKKLGTRTPNDFSPEQIVEILRTVLFEDEGFSGNFEDYENPANSSLEKVLESRKGLPIVVSHVVVSVAERLKIPIVGVPTSGRYIVKYNGAQTPPGFEPQTIYLDPFDKLKILSREDRMRDFPGVDPDQMVPPGTRRDVLIRMLNNIESHLFGRGETEQAYLAVEFRGALQQAIPVKEK